MALAAPTNAAVRPQTTVTMKGSISCSLTGSIKINPGLKTSTPQNVTFTLTGNLSKCTGNTSQSGATITKGHASATVQANNVDCFSLISGGVPDPSGKITWTTTGNKAAPTKFVLSNGSVSYPTVSYTSTQTGSFKGTGAGVGHRQADRVAAPRVLRLFERPDHDHALLGYGQLI